MYFLGYLTDPILEMDKADPMHKFIMDEICAVFNVTLDEIELKPGHEGRTKIYKREDTSGGGDQ